MRKGLQGKKVGKRLINGKRTDTGDAGGLENGDMKEGSAQDEKIVNRVARSGK